MYLIKKYAADYKTTEIIPRVRREVYFEAGILAADGSPIQVQKERFIGEMVVNYQIFDEQGNLLESTGKVNPLIQSDVEITTDAIWQFIDSIGGASVFAGMMRDAALGTATKEELLFNECIQNFNQLSVEKQEELKLRLNTPNENII